MTPQIKFDGLLFSRDVRVVDVMNEVLSNFSIETEICQEFGSAVDAVTHRRLDAIIIDWQDSESTGRIVRSARRSSPNNNSTIVALVSPGDETHALLVGANFMIHKPTNAEHADRCIRAAYGTMVQNRRRAARVPVDIPLTARVSGVGIVHARMTDLSIGGFALQCDRPMEVNAEVLTQFDLRGCDRRIHVSAKVVNANSKGRAGLRFSFIPEDDLETLENWLAVELAKLEQAEMPASALKH